MGIDLSGQIDIQVVASDKEEFGQFAYKLNYEKGNEFAVRTIRGLKMRSLDDLFDEVSASFQFPDYFGENWAALDDCLSDLDWLPTPAGYIMLVSNLPEVLSGENPEQFCIFIKVLHGTCEKWARSKPLKRFMVFLQCEIGQIDLLKKRFQMCELTFPIVNYLP